MTATLINAQLLGYVDHLDAHPHLVELLAVTTMEHQLRSDQHDLSVLIFGTSRLCALATWARTLTDVDDVRARTADGHVGLIGRLADGTPIDVHAVLSAEEQDLLYANGVSAPGETFPVDLLFRLTSPVDAEAVSR